MLIRLFKAHKKPPSERILIAYQAVYLRLVTWVDRKVRIWEKQSIQSRKVQLLALLTGMVLLGSFSVYCTVNGHFFTHTNHKHHERQQSPRTSGTGRFRQ